MVNSWKYLGNLLENSVLFKKLNQELYQYNFKNINKV
jgi:hypothetical protein